MDRIGGVECAEKKTAGERLSECPYVWADAGHFVLRVQEATPNHASKKHR